ncbi:hypothetical protein N9A96_00875 [bacterium]|jgi:hypothetical protein|nr:hypothetical protein [Mariniblastus sp.]MDA7887409.1 hypothetical protein [bacterium]MDA7924673.1 hypothetical protein [Mariniblastus sp.]
MGINDFAILAAMDPTMAWGIIGFGFILLIVFVVLASKTWNWVDITFVVLIYFVSVFTVMQATDVLDQRYSAMNEADKAEKLAETSKADAEKAISGDSESSTYTKGSLRYIDGVLSREMLGRGRVWAGGSVAKEGANRKYTFKAPRADGYEPLADVVLYVFADGKANGENYYIGTVRVESEDNASITFSEEAVVSGEFNAANLSWKLFEKMPLDRRDIFKNYILDKAEEDDASESIKGLAASFENANVELNISDYRDFLRGQFQVSKPYFDAVGFEKLIDRYAFDGLELGTIQQWIDANPEGRTDVALQRFTPDPQETFVKYEFNANSRKNGGYVVDGVGSLETDGLFNQSGFAIEQSLKAGDGGSISFSKGETILIDVVTDEKGLNDGFIIKDEEDVKELGRVYIRQKRDYPFEFAKLKLQTERLAESIQQYEKNKVTQGLLLAEADKHEQERARIIAENDEDKVNLTKDYNVISTLAQAKTKEVASLKQTVSSLESKIASAYQELRKLAVALSREAFAKK